MEDEFIFNQHRLGDFSRVKIDLGSNMLTSVDQQVFLPLLQSMFNNRGRISISPSELKTFANIPAQFPLSLFNHRLP